MSNMPNYTRAEELRALTKLLADMDGPKCPKCGERMDFYHAHAAEPSTGTPAWRGGYGCVCGHTAEMDERDEDTAAAMCVPVVRTGPGGDFTRDWPERKGK